MLHNIKYFYSLGGDRLNWSENGEEEPKSYSVKNGEESGSVARFGNMAQRERRAECYLNSFLPHVSGL